MSGKLDQSLDEILSTQRRSATRGNRRGGRRVSHPNRNAAATAPVGGVKKAVKPAKGAGKAIPTGPSAGSGDSKIVVSGMVSIHSVSRSLNITNCHDIAQGCERKPD
jgi:THO complex subunit 4